MSLSQRALNAAQTSWKNLSRVKTRFLLTMREQTSKLPQEGAQMGEFILVVASVGAPLAPGPSLFCDTKMHLNSSQSELKVPKLTQQVVPKS